MGNASKSIIEEVEIPLNLLRLRERQRVSKCLKRKVGKPERSKQGTYNETKNNNCLN